MLFMLRLLSSCLIVLGFLMCEAIAVSDLTEPSATQLLTTNTTITSISENNTALAIMRGENGVMVINGDKIEIKDSLLMLNNISFGHVGKRSEVRYLVKNGIKTLLVDGKERMAAPY